MKKVSVWLCALVLAGTLWGEAAAQIRVGSITSTRGGGSSWTLDGGNMSVTRSKLLNTANFGLSGIVSPAIQITDTGATITAAVLANFDVLFIGYYPNSTFSAAELSAMQTWVNGGGTIIATCDDSSFADVCTTFGHTPTTQATSPTVPSTAGSSHPIFNGPFGTAASVSMQFTEGYFPVTTGATILGQDSFGSPHATVLLQSFGSGRVIFVSDVDMLSNFSLSAGTGISNGNDRFLGNLFAFAGNGAGGSGLSTLPVPALDSKLLIALAVLLASLALPSLRRRG